MHQELVLNLNRRANVTAAAEKGTDGAEALIPAAVVELELDGTSNSIPLSRILWKYS